MAETYVPKKPCKRGHTLKYVKGGICVECAKAGAKAWKEKNKEKAAANMLAWQRKNRAKVRAANAKWGRENPESVRVRQKRYEEKHPGIRCEVVKRYAKRNPGKVCAIVAKRRTKKLNATPAWLKAEEYDQIAALYTEAARLTRETGVVHHVDHIVPLQNKRVSGLHVPWNLQILAAKENLSKSNKLLDLH